MSHQLLVSAVIVRLFIYVLLLFFWGVTLGHRIADPVTGWSLTVRVYIRRINTATAVYFQPASRTRWPLSGTCPRCHIGLSGTHGFQSGGCRYCLLQSRWPCPKSPSAHRRKSKHPVASFSRRMCLNNSSCHQRKSLKLIDTLQMQREGLVHRN